MLWREQVLLSSIWVLLAQHHLLLRPKQPWDCSKDISISAAGASVPWGHLKDRQLFENLSSYHQETAVFNKTNYLRIRLICPLHLLGRRPFIPPGRARAYTAGQQGKVPRRGTCSFCLMHICCLSMAIHSKALTLSPPQSLYMHFLCYPAAAVTWFCNSPLFQPSRKA